MTSNFVTLILGGTLAAAVGVIIIDPNKVAPALLFFAPLSLSSSFLVFIRAWKSVREEYETAANWMAVVQGSASKGMGRINVKDARLEIVYVFTLMFLPFTVVSFHTFALCLAFFYVIHRVYMKDRVNGLRDKQPTEDERSAKEYTKQFTGTVDRVILARFFEQRARLDAIAVILLGGTWAVFLSAQISGVTWSTTVGGVPLLAIAFLPLLVIAVVEMFVDTSRLLGVHFLAEGDRTLRSAAAAETIVETILWLLPADQVQAPDGGRGRFPTSLMGASDVNLDDESRKQLHHILGSELSQQLGETTSRSSLLRWRRQDALLLVATDGRDTSKLLGYAFLKRDRANTTLRYGIVETATPEMAKSISDQATEVAHDRWPSRRVVRDRSS